MSLCVRNLKFINLVGTLAVVKAAVEVNRRMSGTKTEDYTERNMFDEPEAHQFDWHTTEGLLEGIPSHYNKEYHLTNIVSERIDLLLKKYTLPQLKTVMSLMCVAISLNQKDMNTKYIILKPAAGNKPTERKLIEL